MKYFVTLLLAMGVSAVANAGYVDANDFEVSAVYAGYPEGHIFFQVDGTLANPANCSIGTAIAVDPARSDVGQVLSILLAAQAQGLKVDLRIIDSGCYQNYPVILRVKIKR